VLDLACDNFISILLFGGENLEDFQTMDECMVFFDKPPALESGFL